MKFIRILLTLLLSLWLKPSAAAEEPSYPELEQGYSARIQAIVDGSPRTGSHIVLQASEKVELQAVVFHDKKPTQLDVLRKKFDLTFWWYKIQPSSAAYIDPGAIKEFSDGSQFVFKYLTPLLPHSLSYSESEFSKEDTGRITPDFEMSATSSYISERETEVGTVRWKVLVRFEPKKDGDKFYVSSPAEHRMNDEFKNLNVTRTKEVFLLSRLGNTGYKAYDRALSHLGLPYIWWTGSVDSRLGFTCSQFASISAFAKVMTTEQMFALPGIRVTAIEDGKYKAVIGGQTTFLEYGKHIKPGSVIVYYNGLEDRHAGVIGEDKGSEEGILDEDDMMVHSSIGGYLGGNFLNSGIEWTNLGSFFGEDTLKHRIKIIPAGL